MRRGGALQRNAEMPRTAMPPRSAPMLRSSKPLRPVSKKKRLQIVVDRPAKDMVRERSGGVCEIQVPGVCTGRAVDFSHRVREGQGGPCTPANGGDGCRACHRWLDAHRIPGRRIGWSLNANDPIDGPVLYRNQHLVLLHDDGSMTQLPDGTAGRPVWTDDSDDCAPLRTEDRSFPA